MGTGEGGGGSVCVPAVWVLFGLDLQTLLLQRFFR